MMACMLLAYVILAARPDPSAVFTIENGSIERSTQIPSDCEIFEDEGEMLASVTTSNYPGFVFFCSLSFTSLST